MSSKVTIHVIKLSVRFMHVLYPFDTRLLVDILAKQDYYPVTDRPKGPTELISVSGPIARKEGSEVEYYQDRQVLTITSDNAEKAINEFTRLLESLENSIGDKKLQVFFYESLISASYKGSKSPLETFSLDDNGFKNSILRRMFGEKVSPFGIRLSPSNKYVNSTDWFEYRIEPLLYPPYEIYNIVFIYRNKNFAKVKSAINDFGSVTRRITSALENTVDEKKAKDQ